MAKRILKPPEIYQRLGGIGKTKFRDDYILTGRVKWINLGERTKGLTEEEVDRLVDEAAKNREPLPPLPLRKGDTSPPSETLAQESKPLPRPPIGKTGKPKQKRKAA